MRISWQASLLVVLLLTGLFSCGNSESASGTPPLRIAAAANLRNVLPDLVAEFQSLHPEVENLEIGYGASGKLAAQVRNGAPYDLFMSADCVFPTEVGRLCAPPHQAIPYALGQLVVLTNDSSLLRSNAMEILTQPQVKHIAVAHPETAPYGIAAGQALASAGLEAKLAGRLVYGQDVLQARQYVQTGAAEAGLIARALVGQDSLTGMWRTVPATHYSPVRQCIVQTCKGKGDASIASDFVDFMRSGRARNILERRGYQVPASSLR